MMQDDAGLVAIGTRGMMAAEPWSSFWSHEDAAKLVGAALAAIEAAGWVCVPREPTEEMGLAMYAAWDSFPDGVMGPHEAIAVYRAALSAASKQP
jgi:hypothetical protein